MMPVFFKKCRLLLHPAIFLLAHRTGINRTAGICKQIRAHIFFHESPGKRIGRINPPEAVHIQQPFIK
ncbi:Uncharacterised protein [Mycobacteroides abscessus subsp. abscessus]|nr:Uncharacterised protein [Mycobacteroides abscessus subsp. abscessus]